MSTARAMDETRQDGFTLIELVAALAIAAFAFLALATMLAGTMKSLSISKTRAQANEIATQGIEDLQRYDFNDLGVCPGASDPSPPRPASLPNPPYQTVTLPNCTAGTIVYSQPCSPPAGTLTTFAVPRQIYTCTKNNVAYTVNRFIVWADAQQTAKRLAVYVSWNDQVGGHQVAQESSLRSPNAASVIGLLPPQWVNVGVSASTSPVTIDSGNGTLQSTITFNATTNGLTSSDQVYVTLLTLTTQPDGTLAALPSQFPLTTGNGSTWSATIPGSTPIQFGAGNQYVVFTEVRASDSKANSTIASTPLTFCPSSGCPGGLPTIGSAMVSPTSVDIDSAGVLQSTFTINASTTNLTTDASVSATIQTQTGAASIILQPSNSCIVGGACNNWSATVAPGTLNLRFLPGTRPFYITAIAPVGGSGGTNGASTVLQTNPVTFG